MMDTEKQLEKLFYDFRTMVMRAVNESNGDEAEVNATVSLNASEDGLDERHYISYIVRRKEEQLKGQISIFEVEEDAKPD